MKIQPEILKKKPEPERIEMSETDLEKIIDEIRESSLKASSKGVVINALMSFLWINRQLELKKLSIQKLTRLFFGSKTEKVKKDNPDQSPPPADPARGGEASAGSSEDKSDKDKPKRKGHGKNGQAKLTVSERIPILNPNFKPGDLCPECKQGRLYDYGPGSVLRFTGHAPISAIVYEPQRLRCALCQVVLTAELPKEAGCERYLPSAKAIVSVLTSGAGVPAYRLEMLQKSFGVLLPDSTQFDLREDVANKIHPVHRVIETLSANGRLLHNDDTPNKILALMKENKSLSENERRAMQTTAIVAFNEGHKLALFATGRNHAGENLAELLKTREPNLSQPILMSDASPVNVTPEFRDLLIHCLCLDHGRRNFMDILNAFPVDCRYVIESLAKIYKHDKEVKELGLSDIERLRYHQAHSSEIMNNLNTWMEEKFENREVEPNSNLGEAIEYFLKHWNGLTQFLRVVGAPLSNAEVERLIKKCVLRRKNSMFYKTQAGAWVGDVLMSVIETARLNGANPMAYLAALINHATLVRLKPENWLPWNYQLTVAAL